MQLPHVSWVKLNDSLDIEDWCTTSLTDDNKPLKYDHASHQTKVCFLDSDTNQYFHFDTYLRCIGYQHHGRYKSIRRLDLLSVLLV